MRNRRNEQAKALFHRAGTATVAVAVDTRPKTMRNRARYSRKGRARWSARGAQDA